MQKSGIIRKVDGLGRIVIPKEIRKNLKIREGNEMQMYITESKKITLEKYDPLGEGIRVLEDYIKSLSNTLQCTVLFFDTSSVIFAYGKSANYYLGKKINEKFLDKLLKREIRIADNNLLSIIEDDKNFANVKNIKIAPLIVDSELVGALVLVKTNEKMKILEGEDKILEQSINFLKLQMEL